jgi:formamidopyrimidine-DNA glycosylase
MPEMLEAEMYRRTALRALDREIVEVLAPDAWYLKRGLTSPVVRSALTGRRLVGARRIGKEVLLDTSDDGPVLGLHFGMSGKLLVDGTAAIDKLEYVAGAERPAWDRFGLRFADGGDLVMRDARRLGAVELDPDEGRWGVDASVVRPAELRDVLAGSTAPLKARLMDQSRLAGIGNLLVDETLWRAGLDPARAAGSLDPAELRRLHRHLRITLDELMQRGGSHMGDLHHARERGAVCPRDGAPLLRRTVGGRTTYSCPEHQR